MKTPAVMLAIKVGDGISFGLAIPAIRLPLRLIALGAVIGGVARWL